MYILSLEEKIKLELFPRNLEKSTQFVWERMLTVTRHRMLQKSCVYMYVYVPTQLSDTCNFRFQLNIK